MKNVREGYKMTEIGEMPNDWDVKKLGDVVEVISGATPKTNINEYWDNGDIYWATPTDITSNGKYIYKTEKSITESGLKNCSAKLLPIGSILMSSRATIGERCINNVPMATNQGFKSLVCKSEINNEFIYYYVDILKEKLTGLASGSTFLEVSKKVVEDIKIAIPNLEEQEKIASILSTVDEQINNVDALIEKNKELKKGLMQTLLTKGIGHTKFKETEIGEIPEEWEVKKLGDIFKLSSGNFLSQKNIVEGCYPVYGGNGVNGYHNEYMFQESKLVIGRVGAKCGCICISESQSWITDNALYISEKLQDFNDNYMYYLLKNINLNNYANKNAQPVISAQKIYNISFAFLKIKEQEKIASILSKVDNKIEEYESKKQKLEELKKGLMQQLLTGKIRVV